MGKKRLFRLIWPQIVWAFVYWIIMFSTGRASLEDLFWQIITGHSPRLNATMWFQMAMIVFSALFFLIFRVLSNRKAIIVLISLAALALFLQYSKINYTIFFGLRYELSYPLGRLSETMPYAVIGICFSYFKIDRILLKHKVITIGISCMLFVIMVALKKKYSILVPGFGYAGLDLVISALAIFVVASLFPMTGIPRRLAMVFDYATKYTLGVYCMHRLIAQLISATPIETFLSSTFDISSGTFSMCAVIYLICYLISAVIALIPAKQIRQLVS